jgi:hypothetical protein
MILGEKSIGYYSQGRVYTSVEASGARRFDRFPHQSQASISDTTNVPRDLPIDRTPAAASSHLAKKLDALCFSLLVLSGEQIVEWWGWDDRHHISP